MNISVGASVEFFFVNFQQLNPPAFVFFRKNVR